MANWNGLQLTNKGIALQAKVQAGTELEITKLKLGSGVVPSGTDIKTLTDLITPEQNLGIGGKEAVDDYCKISSTISNTGLEAGYYVRELGVFAQDPDDGEILYMYTTDGAPDYLPAGGGSTVISQEFSVMIAVDDTDNIVVDIDSAALATMGYVQLQIQQHDNNADAHEAAFNAHNAADDAHKDFTGATSRAAGKRGMVPAPAAGNNNRYLKSDGTWGEIDTMQGATSGAAGKSGLVPVPTAGANNRYLSADGTWKTISGMKGATSSAAGTAGLVPAPTVGDQNKALFGDATYKQVVQKVNDIVADSAGNVNLNLKFYSNFEQLGLSANSNNVTDICTTLPNNSIFINYIGGSQYETVGTPTNGVLRIDKGNGQASVSLIRGYSSGSNLNYITYWDSGAGLRNWTLLATADNYLPLTGGTLTGTLTVNNTVTANKFSGDGILPVGTILPFAGSKIPSGFLACNGAAVSRTTYAALYSAIGTTYGSGNGSTTFNLPNVEDNKFLEFASTVGTQKNPGLPNIEGYFSMRKTSLNDTVSFTNGAFAKGTDISAENASYLQTSNTVANAAERINLNASSSNSIYGGSTTVQPKSLTVRAIIKY